MMDFDAPVTEPEFLDAMLAFLEKRAAQNRLDLEPKDRLKIVK